MVESRCYNGSRGFVVGVSNGCVRFYILVTKRSTISQLFPFKKSPLDSGLFLHTIIICNMGVTYVYLLFCLCMFIGI